MYQEYREQMCSSKSVQELRQVLDKASTDVTLSEREFWHLCKIFKICKIEILREE